jgi:L-threonylcarbamoyladenylate synthase
MQARSGAWGMNAAVKVSTIIDARKETHARVIEEVASVVLGGGTVSFPTDTVYGIGCDPYSASAIAKIFGAKQRPRHKPLSLHLATLSEFLEYAREFPDAAAAARRLMPGPVTLIIPKPAFISLQVTGGMTTLGFRVPDDNLCSGILERCGPLSATSANLSGNRAYFGAGDWEELPPADLLIENGPTKYCKESTVIEMTGMRPLVLREGVVPLERLTELLGPVGRHAVPMRKDE